MVKKLNLLVSITFTILMVTMFAIADCPHCYVIIKAQIVSNDGTTIEAYLPYFARYGGSIPLVEGNDIKPNILAYAIESEKHTWLLPPFTIYRKMYFFDGITFGSKRDDITEIKLPDIYKINFLYKTKYQAASYVNILSDKTITLLSGPIYNKAIIEDSCFDKVYINCNPKLSKGEFDIMINLIKKRIKFEYYFYVLVNANRKRMLTLIEKNKPKIDTEIKDVSQMIDSLEEINQKSCLIKYFTKIREIGQSVRKFYYVIDQFVYKETSKEQDYIKLKKELLKLFPSDNKKIYEVTFTEGDKLTNLRKLLPVVKEYFNPIYDTTIQEMLNQNDVVAVTNWWD